jgi:methionyl-tRNA formyltransferase
MILPRDVLRLVPDRFVNCHIAYLPYNRGADPTLWSVLEDTPAGVTVHRIDEGIDTGEVYAQERVHFDWATDTLATAYATLQAHMASVFSDAWVDIEGGLMPMPQQDGGTMHRLKDRAQVEHLLTEGWDTPIGCLRGAARRPAS